MTVGSERLRTPTLDPNFTPPRMPSQGPPPPMHPMDRDPNMMWVTIYFNYEKTQNTFVFLICFCEIMKKTFIHVAVFLECTCAYSLYENNIPPLLKWAITPQIFQISTKIPFDECLDMNFWQSNFFFTFLTFRWHWWPFTECPSWFWNGILT